MEGSPLEGHGQLLKQLEIYAITHGIASSTHYSYSRAVELFGQWLGRPATVLDLDQLQVSRWLESVQRTHAPRTVATHRVNLLTLWRDCADRGLCPQPGRVRPIRKPDPLPIAWTMQELQALAIAVAKLEGNLTEGIPAATYFSALLFAAYETGLRRSDLWRLERSQIRQDGGIVMLQKKTGRRHWPRIQPQTVAMIAQLPGARPLSWPFRSASNFYKRWKRITKAAGVRHGALQQIRRSGATHLAVDHRDQVQRYLGHQSPDMQRHYVDESIASPQQFLPPAIGGPLPETLPCH